jgi:hypothetical protein
VPARCPSWLTVDDGVTGKTNLSRSMTGPIGGLFRAVGGLFMKSIPPGAATTIYAATAPELDGKSGAYLADCAAGIGCGAPAGPVPWHRAWLPPAGRRARWRLAWPPRDGMSRSLCTRLRAVIVPIGNSARSERSAGYNRFLPRRARPGVGARRGESMQHLGESYSAQSV